MTIENDFKTFVCAAGVYTPPDSKHPIYFILMGSFSIFLKGVYLALNSTPFKKIEK